MAFARESRYYYGVATTLDIDSIQALIQFIDTDPSQNLDRKRAELERLPRGFVAALEAELGNIRSAPASPAPAVGPSPDHLKARGAVESAIASFYGPEMAERLRRTHDDLFDDGIDMFIYNLKRLQKVGPA